MKTLLIISALFAGTVGFAQQFSVIQPKKDLELTPKIKYNLPEVLSAAVKQINEKPDVPFSVGFSMYGMRYRSLFSYYELTNDRDNHRINTIYVGHDNNLYYDGYRPIIISMPGAGVDVTNINYYGTPAQMVGNLIRN